MMAGEVASIAKTYRRRISIIPIILYSFTSLTSPQKTGGEGGGGRALGVRQVLVGIISAIGCYEVGVSGPGQFE